MPYDYDSNLELPAEGQSDWDTSLNSNFAILGRGFTFKSQTAMDVGSGVFVAINTGGYVVPHDARSMGLGGPIGFARSSVASGATGYFTHVGIVRSMGVNSLVPGLPVFAGVNPSSLGIVTQSYAGAEFPMGLAIDFSAMIVGQRNGICPEIVTQTTSGVAYVGTTSAFNFSFTPGYRGFIRRLIVGANSLSAYNYKVRLWSGSARVSSELIYETLTDSWSPSSADVTSNYFLDGAGFPYRNTDTASWALLFGTISVQSGHGATSGSFSITIEAERGR